MKTLVASGDIPDWFEIDPNQYAEQLIDKGLLVYIEQMLKDMNVYDNYLPSAMEYQKTTSGKIYTLPIENNIEFFWYNKKMFQDAGVTEPKTFDELLKVCEKLKQSGVTPISICGKDGWPMMRYLSFIPFRMTGNEYLTNVSGGKASMSDKNGMAGLNYVKELGKYFQEGFINTDYTSALNLFIGGKAAIFYMGTWELQNFMNPGDAMKDNIGYFKLPTLDGANATTPDDGYTNSFFTPAVISSVAISQLFQNVLSIEPVGLLNYLLQSIGLGHLAQAWLSNPSTALISVSLIESYRFVGIYMIIFYTALISIPDEYLEAAQLDGAVGIKLFRYIKYPLIKGVIAVAVVMVVNGTLKGFDIPYIHVQDGVPDGAVRIRQCDGSLSGSGIPVYDSFFAQGIRLTGYNPALLLNGGLNNEYTKKIFTNTIF